jgi:flagellar hook-length control protein FliK
MTTAVHGKAALAEMLLDDGAAAGKSSDDDRDKIDTVDFGATLMSLVDPASLKTPSPDAGAPSTTSATAPASGKPASNTTSTATPSPASGPDDAPSVFDTGSVSSEQYLSTLINTPDATDTQPSTSQASGSAGRPLSDRIAALFASYSSNAGNAPVDAGATPADDSAKSLIQTHASGPSQAESSVVANIYTAQADIAATDEPPAPGTTKVQAAPATTDAPSTSSAIDVLPALPNADTSVPNRNIAVDFTKQVFSPAGKDESASAPGIQFSNQPAVTNVQQIAATPSTLDTTTPLPTESANPTASSTQNGTSSALPSQSSSSNSDSMQTSDPTSTQATVTKAGADAATSSEQRLTQQQTVGGAQVAPEPQRTRADGLKDTFPQVKTAPTLEIDSTSDAAESPPAARATEAAAIRQVTEPAPEQSSRSVSITVQLAEGQTAQANVREHAGGIDVKFITANASSAERVSSEIDGMRQNLNAAGITLGQSEVSYQQGDGSGQGRERYRPQQQNQSTDGTEVFVMNEVNQ